MTRDELVMTSIRQAQQRLDMLVRFANYLGLKPIITNNAGFDPNDKMPLIWVYATSNGLGDISSNLEDIESFLDGLAHYLAHELAHYMVATPSLRKRVDYGIPSGKRTVKSNRKWDANEAKVLYVEAHLKDWIGLYRRRDPLVLPDTGFRSMRRYRAGTNKWWKESGEKMMDDVLVEFTKKDV
jgi:hypothetical protein